MAAAEYFSNTPMTQPSYQQAPTSQPQSYNQSQPQKQSTPQIQTQQAPPPPYSEGRPGVHFAPTPTDLHQRHSFSGAQRPSFSSSPQNAWAQPQQQNYYSQPSNALQPHPQYHQQQQQQIGYNTPPNNYNNKPQQYLTPHMRPYANPNSSQFSLDSTGSAAGYSSDPEPHRRKHSHKHRTRRESDEPRARDRGNSTGTKSSRSHSRSTNADAFVGAAGLGLVGDAILPGLGTLGGAALGWFGGRDYGNHRKARESKRSKEQREWEDKYRPSSTGGAGRREKDEYGSRRGSSEMDRRGSYERRHSHY